MRTKRFWKVVVGLVLGLMVIAPPEASGATPLGTAFTYQGRLTDGGSPANGAYDFELKLYDALTEGSQVGSTVLVDDWPVSNGLFTVTLDFGAGIFTGEARWLQIGVRPGASGDPHTPLSPRQELTPVPYALYAMDSAAEGLTLPYAGSTSDSGDAFSVTNTGTGSGGIFTVANGDSWLPGLKGITCGRGHAGNFYISNQGSGNAALFADTFGTGPAGEFGKRILVHGLVESTADGFKFPDGTIQTTVGARRNALDAADGSPSDVVLVDEAGNVAVGATPGSAVLLDQQQDILEQLAPPGAWQSFTCGLDGDLVMVEVGAMMPGQVVLYAGEGIGGTPLATGNAYPAGPDWMRADFDPPVSVWLDRVLTVQYNSSPEWSFAQGNPYPGGRSSFDPSADLAFRTYVYAATTFPVLSVTTGNRVGIGTASPAAQLDVAGTAQMTGFKLPTGAVAGKVLTSDGSGVGTWQVLPGSNAWNVTGNAGTTPGTNFLGTTDNQALVVKTNNAERLRVDANGNVGIGTATPNRPLTIKGQGGYSEWLQFVDSSDIPVWHITKQGGGLNFVETDVYANRLFLQPGGKVGIGTATPGQRLTVAGTIESTSGGFKFPDGTT